MRGVSRRLGTGANAGLYSGRVAIAWDAGLLHYPIYIIPVNPFLMETTRAFLFKRHPRSWNSNLDARQVDAFLVE